MGAVMSDRCLFSFSPSPSLQWQRDYYAKNRDAINERRRKWKERTKDRCMAVNAVWREQNAPRIKAKHKQWRDNNPDKCAAYSAAWRKKNKEEIREKARAKYKEDKRLSQGSNRKFYLKNVVTNPGFYAAKRRKRRAAIHGNSTPEQIALANAKIAALYTAEVMPCPYCAVVFGTKEMEVDHVMPLSRGGGHSPDNVVLTCVSCNRSKMDRLLYAEWVPPAERLQNVG